MEVWRDELYHNELFHYGIKGQKWGIRRFQNKDGTLTFLGKRRLAKEIKRRSDSQLESRRNTAFPDDLYKEQYKNVNSVKDDLYNRYLKDSEEKKAVDNANNELNKCMEEIAALTSKMDRGDFKYEEDFELPLFDKMDDLIGKSIKADADYGKKVMDVYEDHKKELFQARMKDLELDPKYYQVFEKYFNKETKGLKTPIRYL